MHHVFVSYSRRDSAPVLATVEALRASGIAVWIDQRDLEASVPWMDEITLAIEGAGVVVVFDSPAWRESAPCAAELATAMELGATVLFFDAYATPAATVVGEVRRVVGGRSPAAFARTELLVRASIWNRQDRQRAQLVGGRTLKRYRTTFASGGRLPAHVHDFLGASRRRQRRKRTVRVVGSVLATIHVLVGAVSYFVFDTANQNLAMTSARFDVAEIGRGLDALNPYLHLQRLAGYGMEWENAEWESSANALLPELPFAREDSDSEAGRGLFDSTQPAVDLSPDGRFRVVPGSGNEIDVVAATDGVRYRTLRPAQHAVGVAWSPDGTWLAVGAGRDVVLLDVTYGIATRTLTGGAGSVTDVRWSADGSSVVARTASNLTLAWDVSVGTTHSAVAGERIVDLQRMPDDDWAVLTRSGTILLLDPTSLAVRDRFDLGTGAPSGRLRISGDGTRLAFISLGDSSDLVIYDVVDRRRSLIPSGDCDVVDIVFADEKADSVLGACVSGGIMSLDLATGESSRHMTDTVYWAIARSGDVVYAGTYDGIFQRFESGLDSPVDLGDDYLRPASISGIVVSDDGERLYHRGTGANTALGSNRMLDLTQTPVKAYTQIFAGLPVGDSRAVAVSPDGELTAHGFDDGSVWIRKPLAGWNVQRVQPFTGPVRGLAFSADGQTLLMAGDDGQLVLVDTDVARDSESQRRERMADMVERGKALGLYRDALPPDLQPGN